MAFGQVNVYSTAQRQCHNYAVQPVYYGDLGTSKKCPYYQSILIFQVIL